jgi:tetratricopeptide (TPR) repeat protein
MKERISILKFFEIPFHKKYLTSIMIFTIFCLSAVTFAGNKTQIAEPQDTKKLLKEAKKHSQKGEYNEAEKILKAILSRNPQHPAAKLDLAYISLKRKQLPEAYDYAYDVAKADSKNSYAYAILGVAYLGAGNFSEAKTLLTNAVFLDKKEALAWAGLGMLDFYENRIDESILNLREAVYYDSREPDYIFTLAQVSARAEKYKAAADAYELFLRVSPKSDVERRDRIKGLIKFLRYLGRRTSLYDVGGNKETTVKMPLLNNRPTVQIRLDKDGELLNFVLDTGSGISVISEKTSKRLKIKPISKGGVARALGGDGKFDIVYGFLNKVYIGDITIRNVPIYIREFHNKGEEVDGYIGLSLISKFITTVDYGNETFTLTRKNDSDDSASEENEVALPLRLTSSGFLSGQVKLEGIESPLNFIVDTGASVSVISEKLAVSDELSRYDSGETMRVIGAAGITEGVPSFLLPNLSFGNFSRKELKAIALDLNLINETSGFEQSGILGGNFLKNYRLTFDFKNSKVIFVPNIKN